MEAPRIRYAQTVDGVDIAYAILGNDNPGPPILLLNAVASAGIDAVIQSGHEMGKLDALARHRPVVVFDWRGIGVSGAVDEFTMEGFRNDVAAVIESSGCDQFDLIGRLGPSHLAMEFAARNPDRVRRLAVINPSVPGMSPRKHPRVGVLYGLAARGEIEWSLMSEIIALLTTGWHDIEFAKLLFQRLSERFDGPTFDSLLALMEEMDASPVAGRVTCPTLVYFTGAPPSQMRSLAGRIQSADVVIEPPPRTEWLPWATSGVIDIPQVVTGFLLEEREVGGPAGASAFRTILFTDVVASTPLLTQLRDAKMREVMHDHDTLMEAAVIGHGGRVVKTIGDAFMAEFAVPSAAVEAAIEAQRAIREQFADSDVPVRIRIGINAGEPIEEDGDLHGASVVIAKRLESAADSNGILVSDVVKQMVTGKDFDFEDRGPVELKGFDEPVRAWAVRWA